MKNNLKKVLAMAVSLTGNYLPAQVNNYSFTQSMGVYGSVNTGSLIGTTTQDDDITQVSLPFTFNFNGTAYNSANISSNGFISFGSAQTNGYKPISGIMQDLVAPFGQDLAMGKVTTGDVTAGSNTIANVTSTTGLQVGDSLFDFNFDFGGQTPVINAIAGNDIIVTVFALNNNVGGDLFILNGSIRQNNLGLAPNRICEFEYRNFSRFSVYNDIINFKIRLYETSNKIEFVYGSMQPGTTLTGPEVGLRGTGVQDFNSRTVNQMILWANSAAAMQMTDSCHINQVIFPALNLTYQWTPVTCTQPSLTITKTKSVICAGQTVTITASGATSYVWSNGALSNRIVVSPLTSTVYSVTGSNLNCSNTVSVQLAVAKCTDLKDSFSDQKMIAIYPNPVKFDLSVENNNSENFDYHLMDITGSLITSGRLEGNSIEKVKTDSLQPGIYLLTVSNGKTSITRKIIKD